MGTVQHKMMVVLVHDEEHVARAHALVKAELELRDFGHCVSDPILVNNGYGAIFIAPSGSKVGWDAHEAHREALNFVREALTAANLSVNIIYLEDGELGVADYRWSVSRHHGRLYHETLG